LELVIDFHRKVKSWQYIPADILELSTEGRQNPTGTVTSCGEAVEFAIFVLLPLFPLAWDSSWLCIFHKDLLWSELRFSEANLGSKSKLTMTSIKKSYQKKLLWKAPHKLGNKYKIIMPTVKKKATTVVKLISMPLIRVLTSLTSCNWQPYCSIRF
jgi:hypothetical protein